MELQAHGKLWSILHMRCPRCHHGRVFSRGMRMHRICQVCQLRFEREPGYFIGATFFTFVICAMLVIAWFVVLAVAFPTLSEFWLDALAIAFTPPLIPIVLRFSRVLWLTMDRSIDLSR